MTKEYPKYLSASRLMDRWQIYPLDLHVLLIEEGLTAYQISKNRISRFEWPEKEPIDISEVAGRLLLKREDAISIHDRYEFHPFRKAGGRRKEPAPKLVKMIKDVSPELEKLYSEIKKIGFSGRETVTSEHYRDVTMKTFTENRGNFKLIKESYLSDWSLYSFRPGQGKMDFIGKILRRIAQDYNLDSGNYQSLYQIYISTKRLEK